jgi:catalase-peroxidase
LVATAWASAFTFRGTHKRGGANGARIRLAAQKDWAVNNPAELTTVLTTLEKIRKDLKKPVSRADMIVLGGSAAIERAAKKARHNIVVPFTPVTY